MTCYQDAEWPSFWSQQPPLKSTWARRYDATYKVRVRVWGPKGNLKLVAIDEKV